MLVDSAAGAAARETKEEPLDPSAMRVRHIEFENARSKDPKQRAMSARGIFQNAAEAAMEETMKKNSESQTTVD